MGGRASRRVLTCVAGAAMALAAAGPAAAAETRQELALTTSDGVALHATVAGEAPLRPRPLVVEYSPYGQDASAHPPLGPDFNYVYVQARGTGRSGGAWDIMGDREQLDIAETLGQLCRRPFSSGRIGLYGFSASAIASYHAMRRGSLPCVKAASMLAGTNSLYRDLIFIGGMPNLVPAGVVTGAIAGAFLANLPGRAGNPASGLSAPGGVTNALNAFLAHQTEDDFWRRRIFPGPGGAPRDIPILAATGFYDVESRGPFENFKAIRSRGGRLLVIGAHDREAGGSGGVQPHFRRWFEHHLLGRDNGADREPPVQLYVGRGSHGDLIGGRWVKVDARDWPVPGTRWRALHPATDGSLSPARPSRGATQSVPGVPSNTLSTDPYTTATVTNVQGSNLSEATALTYTTPRLAADVMTVGPAALRVRFASTSPEADIYAVLSDVASDGTSNPVAAGRLRNSFPRLEPGRSLTDPDSGAVVQPFNDFSRKEPAAAGQARDYQVEFWPIGNRFERGHRLRLSLVGAPVSFLPGAPGVNTITVGGPEAAALQVPTLPGSDLCAALGARPCPTAAPAATQPCLSARAVVGRRGIGRVRLGMTRARLRAIGAGRPRRTART
ncbi:MAG TPA: CocE/NonD family hydrolase, partial [Thermoleophilaceae bacterium]|nr:CocE/NonD family hydrolase [Thermoleophilaceae bacterium]